MLISHYVFVPQVLPYYDWTWLWEEECLVFNPYYEAESNLTEIDCSVML